ncbi:MAG: type II toxin-antitoxin system RelE/ParE family toxin [Thiobacillus sp.]
MKLVVNAKAQHELRDAAAWYEEQAQGLSAEFLRAVELNLGYVLRNPELFAEVLPGIRRIGLRKFPYSLFYRVHEPKITVLACLHQHGDPQDWPHN